MPCGARRFSFLVQMLLDGPVDHLALDGQRLHIAVSLAGAQVLLAAGKT